MQIFSIALTGLRLAFRSHVILLAACCLLILALSVLLSAQFSGRQPSTVAMDIGLSVIRLLLPLALALITQELLSKEFERRYFLNTLSYPHTRHKILLGRLLAAALLLLVLLLVLAGTLALLTWLIEKSYSQGTPVLLGAPFIITIGFIGLDLLVLTAVAALLAVVATTSSFVLIGTFGFTLVARSFGTILELLTRNSAVVSDAENYRSSLGLLSYLLPDLSALDVRMIALYGRMEFLPADWPWLVLANLTYTAGFLGIAVWALQRKRFS